MEVVIILVFIILAIFLIYIAVLTNQKKCPSAPVIYKNRPKTFEEEQKDYPKASEIFSNLFTDPSTFLGGATFSELQLKKTE